MDQIFLTVLNMSITSTYVLAFVLVLRLLLKRSPKWLSYSLWSVVLFRLVLPISFSTSFSLLSLFIKPSTNNGSIAYIPANIAFMVMPKVDVGIPGINSVINKSLEWAPTIASVSSLQDVINIGSLIWLAGIIAMLIYSIVSYLRLKRRISTATRAFENVFETDNIESPFVCGFIRPRIFLPVGLDQASQAYVLQHERTHLRRFDHVIKLFAFLVLSIHWFNPLAWLAFRLMSRDMEISCDESAVQDLSPDEKADYGEALVHLAIKRPILSGSPLAFGESVTKGRVQNILNYRRPAFWVVVVSVLALVVVSVVLVANPRSGPNYVSYIGQKDWFGSAVYSTIDYQITEDDRSAVEPVLSTAEKVFSYAGTKADMDKTVGALARYYHYSDEIPFSTVKYNLQLITAKVDQSSGYIWIVYSDEQFDPDGKSVSGSSDILSYWKLEKADGKWAVVDIIEGP